MEEYEKLLKASSGELRLAIILGFWTGMRFGEVANLQWKHIDTKANSLRLSRQETKEADNKEIPIPNAVKQELKKLAHSIDGKLFKTKSELLSGQFVKLCSRLGIKDLHFHDLRHTAVTNLRRAGVDLLTIKNITGHKSLKTLERYNRIDLGAALLRRRSSLD